MGEFLENVYIEENKIPKKVTGMPVPFLGFVTILILYGNTVNRNIYINSDVLYVLFLLEFYYKL